MKHNNPVRIGGQMPSVSRNQQVATAIALHAPNKLYARNKGLLRMSQPQLHEFAATKRKGLPERKTMKGKWLK